MSLIRTLKIITLLCLFPLAVVLELLKRVIDYLVEVFNDITDLIGNS